MSTDLPVIVHPDQSAIDVVQKPLFAHNARAAGRDTGYLPFAIHLPDPETGELVGGATGSVLFDWVFVDLLFVPDRLRGQGHGRRLLKRVEDFAREQACVGVWLDTFHFQARPFYEKLGFRVIGTIEGHPVGGARYFLEKRL